MSFHDNDRQSNPRRRNTNTAKKSSFYHDVSSPPKSSTSSNSRRAPSHHHRQGHREVSQARPQIAFRRGVAFKSPQTYHASSSQRHLQNSAPSRTIPVRNTPEYQHPFLDNLPLPTFRRHPRQAAEQRDRFIHASRPRDGDEHDPPTPGRVNAPNSRAHKTSPSSPFHWVELDKEIESSLKSNKFRKRRLESSGGRWSASRMSTSTSAPLRNRMSLVRKTAHTGNKYIVAPVLRLRRIGGDDEEHEAVDDSRIDEGNQGPADSSTDDADRNSRESDDGRSSSESSESIRRARLPVAFKSVQFAARKYKIYTARKSHGSALTRRAKDRSRRGHDDINSSDEHPDPGQSGSDNTWPPLNDRPGNHAFSKTLSPAPHEAPPSELLLAFASFATGIKLKLRGRIPFLSRNVRIGFTERCRSIKIPTDKRNSDIPGAEHFRVTYRHQIPHVNSDDDQEDASARLQYETHIKAWLCPICNVFGSFETREMLTKHLEWDHPEVSVVWEAGAWLLLDTQPLADLQGENDDDQKPLVRNTSRRDESSHSTAPIETPSSSPSPHESSRLPLPNSQPVLGCDDFGPTAGLVPPFLSPSDVDETGRRVYSCRPGGEKLYDILNILSLGQHGLMAWQITETEELLFERDDIRDEDKVILALWLRWIRTNGHQNINVFVLDPTAAVGMFIDAFAVYIRRAGGWGALRVFLLMLCAYRHLTGAQIAQLLLHYDKAIICKEWNVNQAPCSSDDREHAADHASPCKTWHKHGICSECGGPHRMVDNPECLGKDARTRMRTQSEYM